MTARILPFYPRLARIGPAPPHFRRDPEADPERRRQELLSEFERANLRNVIDGIDRLFTQAPPEKPGA